MRLFIAGVVFSLWNIGAHPTQAGSCWDIFSCCLPFETSHSSTPTYVSLSGKDTSFEDDLANSKVYEPVFIEGETSFCVNGPQTEILFEADSPEVPSLDIAEILARARIDIQEGSRTQYTDYLSYIPAPYAQEASFLHLKAQYIWGGDMTYAHAQQLTELYLNSRTPNTVYATPEEYVPFAAYVLRDILWEYSFFGQREMHVPDSKPIIRLLLPIVFDHAALGNPHCLFVLAEEALWKSTDQKPKAALSWLQNIYPILQTLQRQHSFLWYSFGMLDTYYLDYTRHALASTKQVPLDRTIFLEEDPAQKRDVYAEVAALSINIPQENVAYMLSDLIQHFRGTRLFSDKKAIFLQRQYLPAPKFTGVDESYYSAGILPRS